MSQLAVVLWFADEGNTNLATVNTLLAQRRHVVFASAMSGTGESGPDTPQSPFPYSRAAMILDTSAFLAQKAFVLWFADDGTNNLGALNTFLQEGWAVALLTAMSGTGERGSETPQSPFPYSRALVVLQKPVTIRPRDPAP